MEAMIALKEKRKQLEDQYYQPRLITLNLDKILVLCRKFIFKNFSINVNHDFKPGI